MSTQSTEENREARRKRQKRYGTSRIGDNPSNAHHLGKAMRVAGIRISGTEQVARPQKGQKSGDKKSKRRYSSPNKAQEAMMPDVQTDNNQSPDTLPPVNTEAQVDAAKAQAQAAPVTEAKPTPVVESKPAVAKTSSTSAMQFEPLGTDFKRTAGKTAIIVSGALIVVGGVLYGLNALGFFEKIEVPALPELPVGGDGDIG